MQAVKQILNELPLKTRSTTLAKEATIQKSKQVTSSSSDCTAHHKKRIDNLFLKFSAFYGYIWRNHFKNTDFLAFSKNQWLEGLKPYSDEVLAKAILHCRDHLEYPPTLPQLIGLCRKEIKRNEWFKAEEIDVAKPEVQKHHMGSIKKKLAIAE